MYQIIVYTDETEIVIWVCNINGNLENGDYITSSIVTGYGELQDDDLLHNYTKK